MVGLLIVVDLFAVLFRHVCCVVCYLVVLGMAVWLVVVWVLWFVLLSEFVYLCDLAFSLGLLAYLFVFVGVYTY